jgi:D-alanyl-D-alanine dipeptidase
MSEHSMAAVGRVMDELGFEAGSKIGQWWHLSYGPQSERWRLTLTGEWQDVEMRHAYAIDLVTEAVRESTVRRVEDALEALGVTDTVLMHDGMSAVIARALLDAVERGS